MSKTQDKRARVKAEHAAFIRARREKQILYWEENLLVGEKLYEANKENLSPEECAILDKGMKENRELLAKLKSELNTQPEA